MPMATIDPNARVRMIIATTIPTSSLLSVAGVDSSEPIEPPAATSIPSGSAGFSAASRTAWASSSSRSALEMSSSTGMKAVFSSSETYAPPAVVAERARRADHVRHPLDRLRGLVDRLLVVARGELPGVDVEDDRVGAVLLGREAVRQEVGRLLAAGPREVHVVAGLRADPRDGDDERHHEEDPPTPAAPSHRWAAIHRPSRYRNPAMHHPEPGAASGAARCRSSSPARRHGTRRAGRRGTPP